MAQKAKTVVVISGSEDEPGYELYCEPEGAVQTVRPGDQLTFTFTGPAPQAFELTWVPKGLVLFRPLDTEEIRIRGLSV